jgi:hypothetical protein
MRFKVRLFDTVLSSFVMKALLSVRFRFNLPEKTKAPEGGGDKRRNGYSLQKK